LLGGEPMEHSNQQGLLPLVRKIKETYPDKSIWCFSGYLFDRDIVGRMMKEWPETEELLSYIDVMVDGEYVEAKKDLSKRFKGSSNQRTIDVQASLKAGEVVLVEGYE
jgi:anaerobic ribonucleoside-triphosphate reductase activating protein